MKNLLFVPGIAVLLVAASISACAQDSPQGRTSVLKVGDAAPDFTLPDQNNKPVRLSDFRGKSNVVLAFYVLAFTSG